MKGPAKAKAKTRLDVLMVARGMAETRDWAQRLIRAGEVRVNGQVADLPSRLVGDDVVITVENPPRYVSRGGLKLEAALDQFRLDPAGLVCADVGSSTGGFTDCMLQHGAQRVYALDVGSNQLHWKLRQDKHVVVMEGVNVRYLEALPEPVQFAVVDVSFISLTLILPRVFDWLTMWFDGAHHDHPEPRRRVVRQPHHDHPDAPRVEGHPEPVEGPLPDDPARRAEGSVVALIKPQFEAGRDKVGKGGIVRDPAVHQEVIERILDFCARQGWPAHGVIESPILGTDGNKEFLAWLRRSHVK
jgi:23S rRNA (cytidine1920-2'-O)/16S rRNA (cytidine1409-2'-O)-methyltransferase